MLCPTLGAGFVTLLCDGTDSQSVVNLLEDDGENLDQAFGYELPTTERFCPQSSLMKMAMELLTLGKELQSYCYNDG